MKLKSLSLAFLCVMSLSQACKRNDSATPATPVPAPSVKCYPTAIVSDHDSTAILYNSEGRVSGINQFGGMFPVNVSLEYAAGRVNKQQLSMNGEPMVDILMEYSGDKLSKKRSFSYEEDGTTTETEYTTFQYNDKGQIIEEKLYDADKQKAVSYITYAYDGRGNVIKEVEYRYYNGNPVLTGTSDYTYDEKPSPWSVISAMTVTAGSPNNPLTLVRHSSTGEEILNVKYTHVYGSNGYPTSIKETSKGQAKTTTYTYNCK